MRTYKHTPGPWICDGGAVYRNGDIDAPIAHMCRDERATKAGIYPVERDSNAVLIAAAPDLLAACEAVEYYLSHSNHNFDTAHLREAIKKAERG